MNGNVLEVDVLVIGGGIAGLWTLARLRQRGYGALLVEGAALGRGQTICSQGIIHGGTKYALQGEISGAAQAIGDMPDAWRRCLAGDGEVDLRGVNLLADHQYLWATRRLGSRLAGFFASKMMKSRVENVLSEDYPAVLRNERFHGSVYRLDEPVLNVASLLRVLADQNRDALVRSQNLVAMAPDGNTTLRYPDRDQLVVRGRYTVFTAGAGNSILSSAPMQMRPLCMVMARGAELPGGLYAHCLDAGDTPRLTITSHRDAEGRTVWYLGGQLAEDGAHRHHEQQIAVARRELAGLLPWVDLGKAQFAVLRIERAEPRQRGVKRPERPGVYRNGRMITAWPTKLAMAPLMAEEVLTLLERDGLQSQATDLTALADWPRPEVAAFPWDEAREWS